MRIASVVALSLLLAKAEALSCAAANKRYDASNTRRSAIANAARAAAAAAAAAALDAPPPAFASTEAKLQAAQKAIELKAAKEAAKAPAAQIQRARANLEACAPFIEANEWGDVRAVLEAPPVSTLPTLVKSVGYTKEQTKALSDAILELDRFAYGEQVPGAIIRGCIGPCLKGDELDPPRAMLRRAIGALL